LGDAGGFGRSLRAGKAPGGKSRAEGVEGRRAFTRVRLAALTDSWWAAQEAEWVLRRGHACELRSAPASYGSPGRGPPRKPRARRVIHVRRRTTRWSSGGRPSEQVAPQVMQKARSESRNGLLIELEFDKIATRRPFLFFLSLVASGLALFPSFPSS